MVNLVPDPKTRRRSLEKALARIRADLIVATVDRARPAIAAGTLPPERRDELAEAVDRVSATALVWSAPRKSTGALDTGVPLALVPLGERDRRIGTREPWLVARVAKDSPATTFRLTIEDLITENEPWRLDRARWAWAQGEAVTPATRWGGTLDELRPALRAADAGVWQAVLQAAGVATDARVTPLLRGEDGAPDLADLTDVWAPRLTESLLRLAPWKLPQATTALRRGKPMRLFGLGGVNQQRKPGIFLAGDVAGPRLELEFSASNERVPEILWTRPLDLDLVHLGLLTLDEVPGGRG
jgi:hypothetical protein